MHKLLVGKFSRFCPRSFTHNLKAVQIKILKHYWHPVPCTGLIVTSGVMN